MKQVYTIAIETGLQNVGIAFLVISLNFPSPESDYAFLPLIAVTTLTGLPLWILLVVKTVADAFIHKKTDQHVDASTENEEKKFIQKAILP